jgi:DNA-binding transcriptional ArsR family regulator
MDIAHPYAAICPTLDSTVLATLAGTTKPLTGREVARLTGRSSHSGVLDALSRLTEHGLVDRAEAGRALLYSLNREHLAAPAVDVLAGMRAELLERLRRAIDEWEVAPIHASLFGSVARGDGDTRSDVDLFVVRPDATVADDPAWQAQRDDLAVRVQRWTGNRASIAEVSETELAQLGGSRRRIADELRAEAIVLHGPPIAELFRATR